MATKLNEMERLCLITEALAVLKARFTEGEIGATDLSFCMVIQEPGNSQILRQWFLGGKLPGCVLEHLKVCPTCAMEISFPE